jgi:DUF971 family protein
MTQPTFVRPTLIKERQIRPRCGRRVNVPADHLRASSPCAENAKAPTVRDKRIRSELLYRRLP